jgi:hypothetical protein
MSDQRPLHKDPAFYANLIYILGSIGYVIADLVSGYITNDITTSEWNRFYLFLAIVFVLDAVLYWVSWYQTSDRTVDDWFSAECWNVIASIVFVVSARAAMVTTNTFFAALSLRTSIASLNLSAMIIFLFDSLYYMQSWWSGVPKPTPRGTWRTSECMAELTNVVASALYALSSIIFTFDCTVILREVDNSRFATLQALQDINHASAKMYRVYMFADIVYLLSSCVVTWNYHKARRAALEDSKAAAAGVLGEPLLPIQ